MCKKLVLLVSFVLALCLVGTNVVSAAMVIEIRVSAGSDDAEEAVNTGFQDTYNTSSDLEIVDDNDDNGGRQFVGMNFRNIPIEPGAKITNAYIEFTCDASKFNSDDAYLLIWGHLALNPDGFAGPLTPTTISDRPRTEAKVPWEPEPWTTGGQISHTSDISSIINELINQDGWASGNAIELIIGEDTSKPAFTGLRAAESYNGSPSQAPLLHIEITSKYATQPDPPDGALYDDTWVTLIWSPGETAASHDVYMSDNLDDVTNGTGDAFRGNQPSAFFVAGFPGFPYPDGLVAGTTYYWRIDEVEADGATKYEGPVWSFSIPSKSAYNPNPSDGAKYVATNATLSWTAGIGAKMHTVYFGDDFDAVNNATGGLPVGGAATYDPGPLAKNMTYYWRVDEFDGLATYTGDVWSFSTIPDIAITDPDLIGWWKFDEGSGSIALDFSGHGNDGTLGGNPQWVEGIVGGALDLDGSDYVAIDGVVDDITSTNITLSAWIKSTQTSQGDVFAANDSGSGHPLEVYIEGGYPGRYDGGDTTYTTAPLVADGQWHMMTYVREGNTGYIYVDGVQAARDTASFDLSSVTRWSIGQEWDDANPSNFYIGLVDDARFYNKSLTPEEVLELTRGDPLLAWNPSPSNGAVIDIERAKQPLSWSAGDNAAEHDVYFGLDKTAVENADSSDATGLYRGRQAGTTYAPPESLEWGTGPYYWRIDEINTDDTLSTGGIWSFTVADHLIVEDFESYTDDDLAGEAIWQSWIDGFGVADNGAQVGYLLPPYAEQGTVHGGGQSMPLMYDNTAGVRNSEAELALTALRDWTAYGVTDLSIWFRGYPGSVGSFVEGPVGTYTMTASGTDISGTADEFHYAYKTLNGAGSITARVVSLQNTNAWAKAAVMIRESLDPGSRHALACITPGNGVASEARIDTDNASTSDNQTGLTAPYWIKLERDVAGNFSVTHSANGTSWSPVQGAIPNRVLMSANVYIGLAVTSHDAGLTCEAVFSNVTTTGNVSGQWAHQDIGIASNAAEPLYIAVSNAAGAPAIVAHADPAAATIDTWTEWIIPLQAFADQGITLTNVDKIAIGLGNKGNAAAAGGAGTMFIDDIGLYRPEPEPQL
ncbi:LamG domain-containing protein [Planctomycetota bacterium]